jgi:predicted ATP-dependent endonuclease of OLD family
LAIRDFLRTVIDDPNAELEVPYDRDTLIVHMEEKSLPLEALGSGIHEVIILAAAATVLTKTVVCIEEPELHLNPILQKKLVRYLSNKTSNQYFITTHSAALMDTPEAEIYHVTMIKGVSFVDRVTSDSKRSNVCEDLGYHPSDLLQANCVIWVEGPSDRIYLNFWIRIIDKDLIEGVHYSIMFYGGRLAFHLSYEDDSDAIDDFISLRRMNRRGVIVIDSDKSSSRTMLNETKKRLRAEFDKGPGFAWITEGREIENYLPVSSLKTALAEVSPNSKPTTSFQKFDNVLKIRSAKGKDLQASKVEIAKNIVRQGVPDLTIFDLNRQLRKLVDFIIDSNPKISSKLLRK